MSCKTKIPKFKTECDSREGRIKKILIIDAINKDGSLDKRKINVDEFGLPIFEGKTMKHIKRIY